MANRNVAPTHVFTFAMALVMLAMPANGMTLLFQDDFEKIAIGDYPDEHGWRNLFSGKSAYVSDEAAQSGSRSLRLESHPSWARVDYIALSEIPHLLSCELSILPDPSPDRRVNVGFVQGLGNLCASYNKFRIHTGDGKIGAIHFIPGYGMESVALGNVDVNNWMTLRADYDFVNLVADLWVNGQNVATDVPIVPQEFYDDDPRYMQNVTLDKWGAWEGNWSGGPAGVIFVDDVALFTLDAGPGEYGGGTGISRDPYLIYTAPQMNSIGLHERDWDKHFKLMADIDLSVLGGMDFNIIGYDKGPGNREPFTGVFDGSGKTISNFNYTGTDQNRIGLFGHVLGANAEIKDLGLIAPKVEAVNGTNVGSLVGSLIYGTIRNCYAVGNSRQGPDRSGMAGRRDDPAGSDASVATVSGGNQVGGLVGLNQGTISNCHAEASISAEVDDVGGLVGANAGTIDRCSASGSIAQGYAAGGLTGGNSGTITNSRASTSVLTGEPWVGGLVGSNIGTIKDCYATGDVLGSGCVGSLVGGNYYFSSRPNPATISNCYAVGHVSGDYDFGGLVGLNDEGVVEASFWDVETTGLSASSGGFGKTTAQMKTKSMFVNAGWDFDTPIWTIDPGIDYPRLWWEPEEPAKYGGGTGDPNDPYLILTALHMNEIGANPDDWDKNFKLMADIDLGSFTGTDFNLIGYYVSTSDNRPFAGVFDGNGHTISNLSYASAGTDMVGLFAYASGLDLEINDLGLIDPNVDAGTGSGVGSLVGVMEFGAITGCYARNCKISGKNWVGGLVGYALLTEFTDCYVYATVAGFEKVGGLVGVNYAGVVKNCHSVSTVDGNSKIGGLVGLNEFLMEYGLIFAGQIAECYAEGTIEGLLRVGGLVGENLARVTDSYATVDVDGSGRVGGLVGYNHLWAGAAFMPPRISNCYASGHVSGLFSVGGLLGIDDGGIVTGCSWDIQTSGQLSSAGGTGNTTAEMRKAATFLNAGWDFVDETANGTDDIWWILEGQDYPRLWWEAEDN